MFSQVPIIDVVQFFACTIKVLLTSHTCTRIIQVVVLYSLHELFNTFSLTIFEIHFSRRRKYGCQQVRQHTRWRSFFSTFSISFSRSCFCVQYALLCVVLQCISQSGTTNYVLVINMIKTLLVIPVLNPYFLTHCEEWSAFV